MSRTANRLRSIVITVIAVAATNLAISYASGVPTIPEAPRPKSGVPTILKHLARRAEYQQFQKLLAQRVEYRPFLKPHVLSTAKYTLLNEPSSRWLVLFWWAFNWWFCRSELVYCLYERFSCYPCLAGIPAQRYECR